MASQRYYKIKEKKVEYEKQILKIIYDSIDEINSTLPRGTVLEKKPGTILFGADGVLDSMGIVNFIVSIEQKINEMFGIDIILADERAFSQNSNPFESVHSLEGYISEIFKLRGDVKSDKK